MAPKKNDVNTVMKPPRKRQVKPKVEKPKVEKPKLKTPTILRIKIPSSQSVLNSENFSKKPLSVERKLELANAVALAQLCKSLDATEDVPAPVPENKPGPKRYKKSEGLIKNVPVKRKKKKSIDNGEISENVAALPDNNSEEAFKTNKKTPKNGTKKPRKRAATTNEEPTSNEPPKKKGRRKLIRPQPDPLPKEIPPQTSTQETSISVTSTCESSLTQKQKQTSTKVPNAAKKLPSLATKRSSRKKTAPTRYIATNSKRGHIKTEPDLKASLVVSRKTSYNSSGSIDRMSWTQDISSCSTTTCVTVTSNDFVRFNKKLPVLQMVPIPDNREPVPENSEPVPENREPVPENHELVRENRESESESSSSCSSCSSSSSSDSEDEAVSTKLNLSTTTSATSVPCVKMPQENKSRCILREKSSQSILQGSQIQNNEKKRLNLDALSALQDELSTNLSNLEAKLDSRFGSLGEYEPTPKAVFDALKLESGLMMLFREISKGLSGTEDVFARPAPPPPRQIVPQPERRTENHESPLQRARLPSIDHDDDDALSLFAESITGIESSRASIAPEEYVPAPIVPTVKPRSYQPSRIETPRRSTICEVHTADSTSVRDKNERLELERRLNLESQQQIQQVKKREFVVPAPPAQPALRSLSVQEVQPLSQGGSALFRGICFKHYATQQCHYDPCRFSHNTSNEVFAERLQYLGDAQLLREMKFVWGYPVPRRRFAALFTSVLAQRGLTRAMMEALALAVQAPDSTKAIEAALMHLNTVDLKEVHNMITRPLCDAMLNALANTQNFSRFRAVFMNLSSFVVENNRPVPLDVTTKILERVCILPSEEGLARAMINFIKQTDARIYDVETMASFETYLDSFGLTEEFLKEKGRERRPAALPSEPETDNRERYTSPDTTHFDNMNNAPILSPMITRTVDVNRCQTNTTIVPYVPSRPPPNVQHNYNWRSPFQCIQRPYSHRGRPIAVRHRGRHNNVMRSDMHGNRMVRQRPVMMQYGAPNNYPRMPGGLR